MSLLSSLVWQTSYVSNREDSIPEYDCRRFYGDRDTLYNVLADSDQAVFLQARIYCWRNAAAQLHHPCKTWPGWSIQNLTWWCLCSTCPTMPTETERFCYNEYPVVCLDVINNVLPCTKDILLTRTRCARDNQEHSDERAEYFLLRYVLASKVMARLGWGYTATLSIFVSIYNSCYH